MVCNKYVFCVVFLVVYLSIITIIHAQSKPAPPPTATTTEVAENVNRSLYYRNKNIDSSLYFAKIAANIATQTGKTYDLADALYAETVANYAAARYVKSLEYATKGLEISAKYNFVDKSLLFLNEVGLIYAELYDNFLALKYQFKALQLAEARQDTPFKAQLYNNIGLLKLKINPAEGIEYLRKALNIYKETNNTQGIASVYSNLGVAYIYQDSLVQAQGYFEKSLPIYQQAQDYWGQSVCYQNLGKIYTQKQQATLAYNNYEQALKVAKQLSSKELEARSLNGMAKNTNDAIACENLSNQAMRIGRILNAAGILKEANENLANVHKKNKRYDLAYYHQTQCKNLNAQIYKTENSLKLIELTLETQANQQRIEYEQLKKDSAEYDKKSTLTMIWIVWAMMILILGLIIGYFVVQQLKKIKRKQTDLQQKQTDLQFNTNYLLSITETKNQLFYHLSSSLKNPLSSTQSILGMYKTNQINEKELRYFAKTLRIQIKKTIIFLDSLLFWTRQTIDQNRSINDEKVNIHRAFNEAAIFLQPIIELKQIEINNEIPEKLYVNMGQGIATIIARNLLFNCVEYGNGNKQVTINQKIVKNVSPNDTLIFTMTCKMTRIFVEKIEKSTLHPEDNLNSYEISYVVACILLDKNGGGIKVKHLENDMVEIGFCMPIYSQKEAVI